MLFFTMILNYHILCPHMETGMYAYGPAKRPHTAYCEKGEPCVLFIAFQDPLDAFEVMKEKK